MERSYIVKGSFKGSSYMMGGKTEEEVVAILNTLDAVYNDLPVENIQVYECDENGNYKPFNTYWLIDGINYQYPANVRPDGWQEHPWTIRRTTSRVYYEILALSNASIRRQLENDTLYK